MDSSTSALKQHCRSTSKERKLQRRRERERAHRASETAAEKEERLRKRRVRDRANRASESKEQREARLQRKRTRLAAQTGQHRESRLQGLSARQNERLAAETPEQREARLEDMSIRQNERLAAETPEQRAARLQHNRDQHSHLPLLDQPSIQSKMLKFHEHFATLRIPTCPTCHKRFPGLKVNSQSGECLSCFRDKCVPKLYSPENNMDSGPVPRQL